MKIKSIALIGLMTIISSNLSAQDTRDAELKGANQGLNSTYQKLFRRLSLEDQSSLRASEKAWIAFRDADCAFGWGDKRDCLIQRTDEREEQLRKSTYFDAKGNLIELPAP